MGVLFVVHYKKERIFSMNNQRGSTQERGVGAVGATVTAPPTTSSTTNPFEAQQIRIAGHWRVLKKIGSGAFGDIYLGIILN